MKEDTKQTQEINSGDSNYDYTNHPDVIKKRERAIEVFAKYGLPEGW